MDDSCAGKITFRLDLAFMRNVRKTLSGHKHGRSKSFSLVA